MLTNFARLRRPIEQVIRHYPGDFINLSLSEPDWLLITRLQQSLGRIQRISVFFQASTGYPTLSLVLPMVYKLDQYLNKLIQSEDTIQSLKAALTEGQNKLYKYFPKEISLANHLTHAYIIACVLDPRWKLAGFTTLNWSITRVKRVEERIRIEYRKYESLYARLHLSGSPDLDKSSQNTGLEELRAELYAVAEEETNEVTRYLAEPRASAGSDPLDWWRDARYGALKLMAKDYLAILALSAAIESEFSRVSDTVNPRKRNRLSKQRINEMSCLRSF